MYSRSVFTLWLKILSIKIGVDTSFIHKGYLQRLLHSLIIITSDDYFFNHTLKNNPVELLSSNHWQLFSYRFLMPHTGCISSHSSRPSTRPLQAVSFCPPVPFLPIPPNDPAPDMHILSHLSLAFLTTSVSRHRFPPPFPLQMRGASVSP